MSLQSIIQQIKNATLPGENTALRVGSALEQMDAAKRDKLDSLSASETIDMINAVKLLATTGTPFLGTIDPSTIIPAGDFWAFAGEGTYSNAGGIVVDTGEIAIITRVGTTFDSVTLTIPSIVVSPEFDPTTETEAQGGKQIWDAAESIVNKAFQAKPPSVVNYCWDTNGASVATVPANEETIVANKVFTTESGIVKAINANFANAGAITIVVFSLVNNIVTIKSKTNISVSSGLNALSVNIPINLGEGLGFLRTTPLSIKYTDGTAGRQYLSNAGNPLVTSTYTGYIAYNFSVETSYNSTLYTVDSIKKSIDKIENVTHSRVTIEGQSNALGVAATSGLSVSPYNVATINWADAFSRVFIWNPKTDQYENLKIGVNNMASWDIDYVYPGATPTASSFGPEVGLALMWLQTHDTGNLFIDKNVGDGRPISYFQKGQPYYTEKIQRKSKADTWLKNKGFYVNETGFVWIQGENDKNQTKAYYRAQLDQLIQDRITDGFINPSSILVITQINSTNAGFGQGVYDAKAEFITANKMARPAVYTSNVNADNLHLNTTGQINLGIKSGSLLLQSDDLSYLDLDIASSNSGSGFTLVPYSNTVDLSKENYAAYKQNIGTANFIEGANSDFGKMAFYKLTGGAVAFASNFKAQEGSESYNPNLTNVIVFWKEYDLVRYRIENFPFEPFPIDPGVISLYSFTGTPGTMLSAITHTGIAAIGDVTNNGIVASGQGISVLNSTGGFSNSFGFNLTGTPNLKITLTGVTINGFIDIIINGGAITDNTKDFFTFDRTKWSHTHNGVGSGFTGFSTPVNSEMIFTINAGLVSCTVNGNTAFSNRALANSNGGFLGILLYDAGASILQGLKVEAI